jgi:DNA-binding LacI/PurR family transcriptional regulator
VLLAKKMLALIEGRDDVRSEMLPTTLIVRQT